MPIRSGDVTALLKAWRGGDEQALERLTPLVYEHLRKIGRQYVRRERAGARGDATSLVHEAFVRLVDARTVDWHDRAHFLAVSSRIMRRVLVDTARARSTAKRGGGMQRVEHASGLNMDALPAPYTDRAAEICALDDALDALARREPGHRASVLWRIDCGRDRRGASGLSADDYARLEARPCVAGGRTAGGITRWAIGWAHRHA